MQLYNEIIEESVYWRGKVMSASLLEHGSHLVDIEG